MPTESGPHHDRAWTFRSVVESSLLVVSARTALRSLESVTPPIDGHRITIARRSSLFVRICRWLFLVGKQSSVVRWLTTEPTSEVVLDLREAYITRPVVSTIPAFEDRLRPIWKHSSVQRLARRLESLAQSVARTRTGQALVSFLEPPDERT